MLEVKVLSLILKLQTYIAEQEFKLKQIDIYKTYCDLVEYLVLVEYPNLNENILL